MTGKVVITGGASGIGLAVAAKLHADGAKLCLLDLNETALAQARERFGSDRVMTAATDVRDAAALTSAIRAGTEFMGGLSGCVASAGIGYRSPILDCETGAFEKVIAINLTGVYSTLRAAAEVMVERGTGGALVSLASVAGIRGCAERAAYGAAKAGVINLTEVAAMEFAKHGIRANAICPSPIETPLLKDVQDPQTRREWLEGIPMDRYGEPEEVAELTAFLLSGRSSYITGQAIGIDGGWTAAGLQTAKTRYRRGASS